MARLSILLIFSCILLNCYYLPVANAEEGKTWVVCVAGLDIYPFSYGFESGIYKLCRLLAGLDDERLIMISPNRAAYNPSNPFAGSLWHGSSPSNAYNKINVTYNSQEMTTKLFYDILSGNEAAVKGTGYEKVLKSGPQDTVLLVLINVGIYGIMTLTNTQLLWADEFTPFLESLSEKKKFKKMLILADGEAVASFFEGRYLENDRKILAITSGGKEDEINFCHGRRDLQAYTSTCFTYSVVYQLEKLIREKKYDQRTFSEFFQDLRSNRISSHAVPNFYGELELINSKLSDFFGPAVMLEKAFKEINSVHPIFG